MESDFCLGRRWKAILLTNAIAPAVVAVTFVVADRAWWRVVLALAFLAMSVVNLFNFRNAIRAPLISFKRDELVLRGMYERAVIRIPRRGVEGVVWANHVQICLQLRSGQSQALILIGLDRRDKDAVRTLLESWRDGAEPGAGPAGPACHGPC